MYDAEDNMNNAQQETTLIKALVGYRAQDGVEAETETEFLTDFGLYLTRSYGQLSDHHPDDNLTPRELEVLKGMCHGLTNPQIARHLNLAIGTVRNYGETIKAKLGAVNRAHAVALGRHLVQ